MDRSNKQYVKSKCTVKKWESQFKVDHGRLPTKDDIRKAPPKIRESYATYWKLKTERLENSLLDVTADDNAKDSFNSSGEGKDTSLSSLPGVEDDSRCFKPISDLTTGDSSILSDSNEKLDKKYDPVQGIWGSYLNQTKEVKPKSVNKVESISTKYAQKLFVGCKFNKRNPRKPRSFSKPPSKEKVDDEKAKEIVNEPVNLPEPEDSKENHFDLFSEKMKVVIKSTPCVSNFQSLSFLQKSMNDSGSSSQRKLNEGWLERVDSKCDSEKAPDKTNSKHDSLFDSSSDFKNPPPPPPPQEADSDSGEDLVYDSDEDKSQSQNRFILFNPNSILSPPKIQPVREEPKRRPDEEVAGSSKKPKLELAAEELLKKKEESKNLKYEYLEKRLASGKANENFVRINIQKKVFVRGRKRMTFSKFKKQQWKDLKKQSSGLKKCFKCGDIGHVSSSCRKGKEEPEEEKDVYEFEEESPFPTLEEAEETAKNSSKSKTKKSQAKVEVLDLYPSPEEPSDSRPAVGPLFSPNADGSVIDAPPSVYEALREFGLEEFRSGQEKAIMRILSGQSTLVTLATGTGKSLCYQLPAYLYAKYNNCITLVVSPLVSLMEDQVFCGASCLKVACLHTNQTPKVREAVLEQLKEGNLNVLLVSPEALASGDKMASYFLRLLPPIAFACVDEAHCVSEWSHNFRPSYLTVCQVLREKLGVRTILGLTATATASTMQSILDQFGLPKGDLSSVISDTPLPDNLVLSVSADLDKDAALVQLLQSDRFVDCSSIVIYCTRRETCDKVACFLRATLKDYSSSGKVGRLSTVAEAYHAGLSAGRRKLVQKSFMAGNLRVVVATVAFGMGINKNDIRGIIHYNLPSAFESYVQEVGRAGRDGKPACCHLFLDHRKEDLSELRKHIYSNSVDRHVIRKLLELVFVPCKCTGVCSKHEVAFSIDDTVSLLDLPQENILTLLCYLELHPTKWVQVLSPVYTKCKVSSYKGPRHLRETAKSCPPLAVALALEMKAGRMVEKSASLEFDVVKVANFINWESGMVKHTLKNLEWTKVDDKPRKSGLVVELSNLGLRILSAGNLTGDELDSALDILHDNVLNHERKSLRQLQALHSALKTVAFPSVEKCLGSDDPAKSDELKTTIRTYFTSPEALDDVQIEKVELVNEECATSLIRQLISTHSDQTLTGRSIARVLHGIGSPNFPPIVWGRTRFWRALMSEDFNLLCRLATKQLILMR